MYIYINIYTYMDPDPSAYFAAVFSPSLSRARTHTIAHELSLCLSPQCVFWSSFLFCNSTWDSYLTIAHELSLSLSPQCVFWSGFLLCPMWCLGWLWINSKEPSKHPTYRHLLLPLPPLLLPLPLSLLFLLWINSKKPSRYPS